MLHGYDFEPMKKVCLMNKSYALSMIVQTELLFKIKKMWIVSL